MKKCLIILVFILFAGSIITGCTGRSNASGVDVDLTKLSITMRDAELQRIFLDSDRYMGKTIKATGSYDPVIRYADDIVHNIVIIQGDECCQLGFEFQRTGDYIFPDDYPEKDATIELTGKLGRYEDAGMSFLYLSVTELNVLN